MEPLKTALVLGGGGARGAYEAGVVAYLREELEPAMGRPLPLSIFSGTSVGALNACHLAAHAQVPHLQSRLLVKGWRRLQLEDVLRVRPSGVLRATLDSLGLSENLSDERAGIVDPRGLRELTLKSVWWPEIGRALRQGKLDALSVSATHLGTGRIFTFIQRSQARTPPWSRDPHFVTQHARIGPRHALASAAIPLVFPPVRIGRSLFVDGGIRLNVPLSPAVRLGADRVVVVSLRNPEAEAEALGETSAGAPTAVTLPFLAGKALNALMLDRTEQDLERLRKLNAIIDAGTRAYGEDFSDVLHDALVPHRSTPVRYVRNILIHPSVDLATLAVQFSRSPGFIRRARGISGRIIRHLAEREARGSADLLTYLLFDGEFADIMIELGRRDAKALFEEWVAFFSEEPCCAAEAIQLRGRAGGTPFSGWPGAAGARPG
jgi:NTE family protein